MDNEKLKAKQCRVTGIMRYVVDDGVINKLKICSSLTRSPVLTVTNIHIELEHKLKQKPRRKVHHDDSDDVSTLFL